MRQFTWPDWIGPLLISSGISPFPWVASLILFLFLFFSSMLCKRRDVSLVGVPGAKIDCFILSHYHFTCCS